MLLASLVFGLSFATVQATPTPPAQPAEALFAALRAADFPEVRRLIEGGASIESRNSYGMTPAVRAAMGNAREVLDYLIGRGADLTAQDDSQYRAFDYAIERARHENVAALLEHWARAAARTAADRSALERPAGLSARSSEGVSPEFGAALLALLSFRGDLGGVTALLDLGVPVDAIGASGYQGLALAARSGHGAIVDLLLKRGASPNLHTQSRYNSTPLMEASRDGRVEIAQRLLNAGARVNEGDRHGDHALNWACFFGEAPFVALLVDHGADLIRIGQTDDQPIEIAIREGHTEVVKILTAAGAKARPGKDKPPVKKP